MAPRASLTPLAAPGSYVSATVAVTFTAADVANGNQFVLTGRELLLIRNADAGAPHTFTLTSIADQRGRLGTITNESLPANEFRMFGPIELEGWLQSDGKFYLSADSASIQFAVIRLPR